MIMTADCSEAASSCSIAIDVRGTYQQCSMFNFRASGYWFALCVLGHVTNPPQKMVKQPSILKSHGSLFISNGYS